MAFKFIALFATLAFANAGLIAEQPAYASLSYAAPVKTLVQPVAYSADQHYYHASAPQSSSSQSFTKTISHSQPKAYVAQPAIASYQSYEPEQHYYHAEPQQHVYAAAPAYGHYEHGSSEQNIVRSAHGTVSHISKAVDTPHSSVRKYDTRIINDGYKTVSYAQPAVHTYAAQPSAVHTYASQPAAVHTYSAQPAAVHTYSAQPAVHSYAQPLLTKAISQPIVQKTIVSQPIISKTVAVHHEPAHTIQYSAQPAHYQYAAQPQQYHSYAQHAPVLASKSVHYSPAIEVAHASFESPVAHYSW